MSSEFITSLTPAKRKNWLIQYRSTLKRLRQISYRRDLSSAEIHYYFELGKAIKEIILPYVEIDMQFQAIKEDLERLEKLKRMANGKKQRYVLRRKQNDKGIALVKPIYLDADLAKKIIAKKDERAKAKKVA